MTRTTKYKLSCTRRNFIYALDVNLSILCAHCAATAGAAPSATLAGARRLAASCSYASMLSKYKERVS